MAKKKKAAALPAEWALEAEALQATSAKTPKTTGKPQLSRKQQRRLGKAGWTADSPEQEQAAPATAPPQLRPGAGLLRLPLGGSSLGEDERDEGDAGQAGTGETPRCLGGGLTPRDSTGSKELNLSRLVLPSPEAHAASLARSSGSKKWGLPLRYPSHDTSPLVSARAGTPPDSARIQAARGEDEQQQRRWPALGFAVLADEGAGSCYGSDGDETYDGGGSPARSAACGFAILAGGDLSEAEEEVEQQQHAVEEVPARAAASFSFGAAAPASPAWAASSPPAPVPAAATSPPVLSPEQLQQGARLFSFASVATATSPPLAGLPEGARSSAALPGGAGGCDSEEEQFFSVMPSRVPSAALTAYASARSLSRSGEDSPAKSTAATPFKSGGGGGEACLAAMHAVAAAAAGAGASVLHQLQQTAELLNAAAEAAAEEGMECDSCGSGRAAQLTASEDGAGSEADEAPAAAEELQQDEEQPGGQEAAPLLPSPFAGESFLGVGASSPPPAAARSTLSAAAGSAVVRDSSPPLPEEWGAAAAAAATPPRSPVLASTAARAAAAAPLRLSQMDPWSPSRAAAAADAAAAATAAGDAGLPAAAAATSYAASPDRQLGSVAAEQPAADASVQPSPQRAPAAQAACDAMRELQRSREQGPAPRQLLQEAQRHLMCAFDLLPSSSGLSATPSSAADGLDRCGNGESVAATPSSGDAALADDGGDAAAEPEAAAEGAAEEAGEAAPAAVVPAPAPEAEQAAPEAGLPSSLTHSQQLAPAAAAAGAALVVASADKQHPADRAASSTDAPAEAETQSVAAADAASVDVRASVASSAGIGAAVEPEAEPEAAEPAAPADSFLLPAAAVAASASIDVLRASVASSAGSGDASPAQQAEQGAAEMVSDEASAQVAAMEAVKQEEVAPASPAGPAVAAQAGPPASDSLVQHGSINTLFMQDVTITTFGIPLAAGTARGAAGGSPAVQRSPLRRGRCSAVQILPDSVVHAFTPPPAPEAAAQEAAQPAAAPDALEALAELPEAATDAAPEEAAAAPVPAAPAPASPWLATGAGHLFGAATGGLFGFGAAAVASPAAPVEQEAHAGAAEPAAAAQGGMLDPASPQALEAIAEAPQPAGQQQQGEQPDGLVSAELSEHSKASTAVQPEGEEAGGAEEQRSPLLERQQWRQCSTSLLWRGGQERAQADGDDAPDAVVAAAMVVRPPAFSPGPLQRALLCQQQEQAAASQRAGGEAAAPLDGSASGPFAMACSKLSGEAAEEDGQQEVAEEEAEGENESPCTEPLRYSGAKSPGTHPREKQHTLAAAAAAAAPSIFVGAAMAAPAPHTIHPSQLQGQQGGKLPGAGPAWSAAEHAGLGSGSKAGDGASWQPYGLWQEQKERLLQARGQHGHSGDGIPASWQEQQVQPQQPATPASQHSGVGGQVLPPALQAAALADAIAAAAGSSSPMAKSVRAAASLPQSPMRSPVRYSPESQRQRQRFYHLPPQSPSAATAAPPSPGQAAAGAALFAAAAAAAAASPVQAPQSVPPSPAQYSPESLRCRQDLHHQQQLAPVRVPPASAVLAAEQAALAAEQRVVAQVAQATSGRHSPGSRWQRQAAAAQQAALAQAQLRRLLSEQQQEMQAAAAEAEAEAEGLQAQAPAPTPTSRFVSAVPAEQQQQRFATATTPGTGVGSAGFLQTPLPPQHSAACAAMMISARLAQAEQLTPIAAIQALRSSIALMAPPPGAAAGSAQAGAWSGQQQQMQSILARLEARFREQRQRAQEEAEQRQAEAEQRHALEQQVYELQQQVQGLQAAADEADTLRLELLEARREAQELQRRARAWQDDEQASERRRQQVLQRQAQEAAAEEEWRRAAAATQLALRQRQAVEDEQARLQLERQAVAAEQRRLQLERQRQDEARAAGLQEQQRQLRAAGEARAAEQQRVQLEQQRRRHALERERQEQLRREQESAAAAQQRRRRQVLVLEEQRGRAAAAAAAADAAQVAVPPPAVHPYDAAYNVSLKQQLLAQQAYYTGPSAAVAANEGRSRVPQGYATVNVGRRPPAPAASPQSRGTAASALDPRAFAPLGAGVAATLQPQQYQQQNLRRQRSDGATGVAGPPGGWNDPRYYRTIG